MSIRQIVPPTIYTLCAIHAMNLHKTTFLNSDISVAVGSLLRESIFFDPPLHRLANSERLSAMLRACDPNSR